MAEAARGVRLEGVRNVRLKLLLLGLLCLLPGLGATRMAWADQAWWPLALYPAMSLISLLLYWQDKQQARTQAWRTPEKVLHASELLGGWPGHCWRSSCSGTRRARFRISWCAGGSCCCTRCSGRTGCFLVGVI